MPTIEQIELDLPDGFHDAKLCKLDVDYERGEAVMTIRAEVSNHHVTAETEYRRGELRIRGVRFLSMDVPRSISEPRLLWLDAGSGQPSTSPVELPPLPSNCFLHWFFVNEWNGFIRLAASNAQFRWVDGGSP
jgi:hypothetical protein